MTTDAPQHVTQSTGRVSVTTLPTLGDPNDGYSRLLSAFSDRSYTGPLPEWVCVAIDDALDTLGPTQAYVMRHRFGIGELLPQTQRVIGADLKVSGNRISQIEAKARRMLWHPSRLRGFIAVTEGIYDGLYTPPMNDQPSEFEWRRRREFAAQSLLGETQQEFNRRRAEEKASIYAQYADELAVLQDHAW